MRFPSVKARLATKAKKKVIVPIDRPAHEDFGDKWR